MARKGQSRTLVLTGAIAVMLALSTLLPTLAARFCANVGMLLFRDALLPCEQVPTHHLRYSILTDSPCASKALAWLHNAASWAENDPSMRWAWGRTALAAGDNKTAVGALMPLQHEAMRNPLLYADITVALSRAGQPTRVIAWYETAPPSVPMQVVSESLALAYLESNPAENGRQDKLALESARATRPGDLYVNYSLWRQAQEAGDAKAELTHRQALIFPPLDAIDPMDERLLGYAAEIIPHLLSEGLWDREKTLNAVAFLVWQHPFAPGVEQLLGNLMAAYPYEADWAFYRGELYHRRGDLEQAEVLYQQVLSIDPWYSRAFLHLGLAAESVAYSQVASPNARARLEEAARWYEQYHVLAPGDLCGLEKLATTHSALGRADAQSLQERVHSLTDNRRIAAELLGMPAEDIELGPNLIDNGHFESWLEGTPRGWIWSDMFNRDPFGNASFAVGAEDLSPCGGGQAVRVDGFWVQPQEGKSAPRAGVWYWNTKEDPTGAIPLAPNTAYLLSFYYMTTRVPDDKATVWVSSDPGVFWIGDHKLPATGGACHRFIAVASNSSIGKGVVRPLLRSFAPGSVQFDDVQLRPLLIQAETPEISRTLYIVVGDN